MENNEASGSNIDKENNQYLEIYKLHFDNMNKMSDRRVNVNRYYILALSIIILALTALFRSADFLSAIFTGSNGHEHLSSNLIAFSICFVSILGGMLSDSWTKNVLGYLETNSHRYEVIKHIECNLEYSFINKAYARISDRDEGTEYFSLALHELYAPLIFQLGFTVLLFLGVFQMITFESKYMIPISLMVFLIFVYFIVVFLELRSRR